MDLEQFVKGDEHVRRSVDYILAAYRKYAPDLELRPSAWLAFSCYIEYCLVCKFFVSNGVRMVRFTGYGVLPLTEDDATYDERIALSWAYARAKMSDVEPLRGLAETYPEVKQSFYLQDNYFLSRLGEEFDDCYLPEPCVARLHNLLRTLGVSQVKDLRPYDKAAIMRIPDVGKHTFGYLNAALVELYYQKVEADDPRYSLLTILNFVPYGALWYYDAVFAARPKVAAYLASVEYDENRFAVGSIGYLLCTHFKTGTANRRRKRKDDCVDGKRLGKVQLAYNFVENVDAIVEAYTQNERAFVSLCDQWTNAVVAALRAVRATGAAMRVDIACSYYGFGTPAAASLREVSVKFGRSTQGVRNACDSVLLKAHAMLWGLPEYAQQSAEYQKIIDDICRNGLEAFCVYLALSFGKKRVEAFCLVTLGLTALPNDDSVWQAVARIKEQRKRVEKEAKRTAKNQERPQRIQTPDRPTPLRKKVGLPHGGTADFIVDENGRIQTDAVLFEKLRQARRELAEFYNCPLYFIYSNAQLVALATYKPQTMAEYVAIKGLGEKTWEKKGIAMVQIIKEHMGATADPNE